MTPNPLPQQTPVPVATPLSQIRKTHHVPARIGTVVYVDNRPGTIEGGMNGNLLVRMEGDLWLEEIHPLAAEYTGKRLGLLARLRLLLEAP